MSRFDAVVTGAGGFVGGHVARTLAASGLRVLGLSRRPFRVEPDDPPIEWRVGDLRDRDFVARSLEGARWVAHCGGWVSLGSDRRGLARAINVEATRALRDAACAAGVERLVFTSTLHTLAAGTEAEPADERTPWNLEKVDSPYCRSKREAERLLLEEGGGRPGVVVLCPGMVLGPRDPKPTSTRILLALARSGVVALPGGGIPVVDAGVVALAHLRALERGEPGRRYAVVGPYLAYRDLARIVASLTGRPRRILGLPDTLEGPIAALAGWVDRLGLGGPLEVSRASAAGAFLRLHARGDLADAAFGLEHPDPAESVERALRDAARSGLAPGLRLRPSAAPVA